MCPAMPPLDALPFRTDRAAGWQQMHDAGDVAVSEEGAYFLIGADEVEQAAKSPGVFSSQGAFSIIGTSIHLPPITLDPPEHTRYRRKLDKFFSPRAMAGREPELRRQVGELIDRIKAAGETCDVMSALAIPFPSQVFLTLSGLPLQDRDRLIAWKNLIIAINVNRSEPPPEVVAAVAELYGYLSAFVERRRTEPCGDDLLSQLLIDCEDGAMADEEIIGLCILFVLAGLDTVTAATGFAMEALARDSELRRRTMADAHSVAQFVEESLRRDAVVPNVPRVATEDVDVAGVTIPAGSSCFLGFGAANHDPERFADPDAIHQERANHFAFGRGPHRCLGSHLARLELRLIIEEWNRRIPDYSLISEPSVAWPSATLSYPELLLKIS